MMVDIIKIKVKAGDGGDGHVSFRREKFIPRGGPDGGDGGNAGNVYLKADSNMSTLMDFRSQARYEAQNGQPGAKRNMSGISGEDLYIPVPVGTLVYDEDKDGKTLVGDLDKNEQTLLITQGGKGGKGNYRFKSSTNRTPYEYTPGGKGEEKDIILEVKLIADIGIVGMPNAGKSTLINHLTNANVKVADYPFTTLMPNLGVWKLPDGSSIIVADVPGLIEGASRGKGLGDEFLRHIERTRILIHIIDAYREDCDPVKTALESYDVIRKELNDYSGELLSKREIIAINKIDITEIKESLTKIKSAFKKKRKDIIGISGVTGEGIKELQIKIMEELKKVDKTKHYDAGRPVKKYTIDNLPNSRAVFK